MTKRQDSSHLPGAHFPSPGILPAATSWSSPAPHTPSPQPLQSLTLLLCSQSRGGGASSGTGQHPDFCSPLLGPSPHTVPPELLSNISKSFPPGSTHPSAHLPLLAVHQGGGSSVCPLLPPLGPCHLSPRFRTPTYPQPNSHHHHEVDNNDRDVGRIADALIGLEGLGGGRGRRAPGTTVHDGGRNASLQPRPLAPYMVSGLMISPGEGTREVWQQCCLAGAPALRRRGAALSAQQGGAGRALAVRWAGR